MTIEAKVLASVLDEKLPGFHDCTSGITAVRSVYVYHGPIGEKTLTEWLGSNPRRRVLLVHGKSQAFSDAKQFRGKLGDLAPRLFGMTQGWEELSKQVTPIRKVLAFLASKDDTPGDAEVQRLLGFDMPVRRMALEFALRLVKEARDEHKEIDVSTILKPAANMLLEADSLTKEVDSLAQALRNPPERWNELITPELINVALMDLQN